jgi:hypothetical protein
MKGLIAKMYLKMIVWAILLCSILLFAGCDVEQLPSASLPATPPEIEMPTPTSALEAETPSLPILTPTAGVFGSVVTLTIGTTPITRNVVLVGQIGEEVTGFAAPSSTIGFNSSGLATNVAVKDQYAYVVQGADGPMGTLWGRLSVIDVSNPRLPSMVGFYQPDHIATDVVVVSDTAYLTDARCEFGAAACWGGLHILDVTDPTSPTRVGFYELSDIQAEFDINRLWYGGGVAVANGYAYVTGGPFYESRLGDDYGLRVVDTSRITEPIVVGTMQCTDESLVWEGNAIVLQGSYAFIAAQDAGLRIVNVADVFSPTEVSYVTGLGTVWDLALEGNYAYVVGDEGLHIVEVSDPATPVHIVSLNISRRVLGVIVSEGYAYMAASNAGLRIIDVSVPTDPMEVGFYNTHGWASGVALGDGHIFVADAEKGLLILRFVSSPAE